jgi:hypothetical protein
MGFPIDSGNGYGLGNQGIPCKYMHILFCTFTLWVCELVSRAGPPFVELAQF